MARSRKTDPLETKIVAALDPGTFIPDRKAFDFDEELQEVAGAIEEIMDTDPLRASSLFETFIAACHEKAEEVDDSSGLLGMFVEELFVNWVKSCQAADLNRQDMIDSLIAWIEDDPYGFCYCLEDEIVHVMDKESLDIFADVGKTKCEASSYSEAKLSQIESFLHRAGSKCTPRIEPRTGGKDIQGIGHAHSQGGKKQVL